MLLYHRKTDSKEFLRSVFDLVFTDLIIYEIKYILCSSVMYKNLLYDVIINTFFQ